MQNFGHNNTNTRKGARVSWGMALEPHKTIVCGRYAHRRTSARAYHGLRVLLLTFVKVSSMSKSTNAMTNWLATWEAKKLAAWQQVQRNKRIWPCPHYKDLFGDRFEPMAAIDDTDLMCSAKHCLKGHRCLENNPLPQQRTPKHKRPFCGAKTRAGGICKAKTVHGKSKCRMHGGLSTGPRTPQGKAAIIASNKRRALVKRDTP